MSIKNASKIVWVTLLATLVVVSTVAALVLAIDFVLLAFLGLLFGVYLTKTSTFLQRNLVFISYGWTLGLVTVLLLVVCTGTIFLFGVQIEERLSRTSRQLDESADQLEPWLSNYPIAATAFRKIPFTDQFNIEANNRFLEIHSSNEKAQNATGSDDSSKQSTNSGDLAKGRTSQEVNAEKDVDSLASSSVLRSAAGKVFGVLGRLLSTTFGLVANIGVVFFIGIFVAADPSLYRDGFGLLFPPDNRNRVAEVMNMMGESMYDWLKGRFLTMVITGLGTSIALMILGVPMPITIGVITGFLTFIPNIGAIVALGLAMLMALSQGPMTVVWVVIVYGILQLIESNVVTPLIQQRQTSIPPALLLTFQILMAALTGILGVMVATPLLAGCIVLVKEVWIKDVLENQISHST